MGYLTVWCNNLEKFWGTLMTREAEDYRDPESCDFNYAFTKPFDGHEVEVVTEYRRHSFFLLGSSHVSARAIAQSASTTGSPHATDKGGVDRQKVLKRGVRVGPLSRPFPGL
ncbi:hypothetical protein SAMN05216277_10213 [Halolamina pelagica]|uniref:Uncharacterized protein n=2 Tax=Halolamina pelagica TaxID=699431 RepID=A0A1I5NGR1_9EURY|nr:hypothetical protein SAMN05216277_10213 [Halolamina pelagica]